MSRYNKYNSVIYKGKAYIRAFSGEIVEATGEIANGFLLAEMYNDGLELHWKTEDNIVRVEIYKRKNGFLSLEVDIKGCGEFQTINDAIHLLTLQQSFSK